MKLSENLKKVADYMMVFFNKKHWFIIISLILGLGVGSFLSTHNIVVYKQDNPAEEMFEKMIENKLGINIDITPDSKEKYIKEKSKLDDKYASKVAKKHKKINKKKKKK